jgi:hypothetical protein
MAPNHIKAIWKVVVVDSWIFRKLFGSEVRHTSAPLMIANNKGQYLMAWTIGLILYGSRAPFT